MLFDTEGRPPPGGGPRWGEPAFIAFPSSRHNTHSVVTQAGPSRSDHKTPGMVARTCPPNTEGHVGGTCHVAPRTLTPASWPTRGALQLAPRPPRRSEPATLIPITPRAGFWRDTHPAPRPSNLTVLLQADGPRPPARPTEVAFHNLYRQHFMYRARPAKQQHRPSDAEHHQDTIRRRDPAVTGPGADATPHRSATRHSDAHRGGSCPLTHHHMPHRRLPHPATTPVATLRPQGCIRYEILAVRSNSARPPGPRA